MGKRLNAKKLQRMVGTQIFSVEDAAVFLGIEPGSVRAAAYRKRLSSVRYAGRTYFTRADLWDYRAARNRGLASEIEGGEAFFVPRLGQGVI